jgi:hypothetical protein
LRVRKGKLIRGDADDIAVLFMKPQYIKGDRAGDELGDKAQPCRTKQERSRKLAQRVEENVVHDVGSDKSKPLGRHIELAY